MITTFWLVKSKPEITYQNDYILEIERYQWWFVQGWSKKSNLWSNSPEDVNSLVTEYNQCLRGLLDKHAPLQTRIVNISLVNPCYNEEIAEEKTNVGNMQENGKKAKHQQTYT